MNLKDCKEILQSRNDFLLLTHRRPDGDTVGSAAALCHALRRIGKTAYLYPNKGVIEKLLPYALEYYPPQGYQCRCTVALDTATKELLAEDYDGEIDLSIDHHPSNSGYAKKTLLWGERSSCGEIVLELIKHLCGNVDPQEATLLYIALSTDTGCFKYSNVNAATFRAAAELIEYGADNHLINTVFFRKVSVARLRLEGMIYSGMSLHRDNTISVVTITREMMEKAGATEDDCDDIAGLAGRADGSYVNVTIREMERGECKISVRSGPKVSSSEICSVFGGGGHKMAAGCTIYASPEGAKEILLAVIDEIWK